MRVYDGAVESMTEAGSKGVGVRVFREGRSGYAYGSDLSEEGLRSPRARGVRVGGGDGLGRARRHCPDGRAPPRSIGSSAPGFGDWTMERRVELALAVERAARERDPLVSNVEDTVYADSEGRVALANSNGFCSSFEQTQCYAYAYAFAGEGADRMTGIGLGGGSRPGRASIREADRRRGGRPRASRCTARASRRAVAARWCSTRTSPPASLR